MLLLFFVYFPRYRGFLSQSLSRESNYYYSPIKSLSVSINGVNNTHFPQYHIPERVLISIPYEQNNVNAFKISRRDILRFSFFFFSSFLQYSTNNISMLQFSLRLKLNPRGFCYLEFLLFLNYVLVEFKKDLHSLSIISASLVFPSFTFDTKIRAFPITLSVFTFSTCEFLCYLQQWTWCILTFNRSADDSPIAFVQLFLLTRCEKHESSWLRTFLIRLFTQY